MATAVFTTVEARVDQQLTNAIWADEVKDNVNQLAGSHRNLLTNGGFELWQRGAGGFTATSAYTADRWQLSGTSGTITVTQETSIVDSASAASLKAVTVGSPVSWFVAQVVEGYQQLRGRTLSVSIRMRQSVASACSVGIYDGVGSTISSTSATTGSYVTYTVSRTIDAAATSVSVQVGFTSAATFYLDNAMLVIGPAPAPYQPLHPADELHRCQRYYEVIGGVSGALIMRGNGGAGIQEVSTVYYKATKAVVPTLTKGGTWAVTNCGQPTFNNPSVDSCNMAVTPTAGGLYDATPNSADDVLQIEANP